MDGLHAHLDTHSHAYVHTVCVCVYARASVCESINALFVAGFVVDSP